MWKVAILTNFCSWLYLLYCGTLLKYTQSNILTDCTAQCCSIIWRIVPLNVTVLFDWLYRPMFQYYLTNCTAQFCSITWRTVPLYVAVIFDEMYRPMLQYYLLSVHEGRAALIKWAEFNVMWTAAGSWKVKQCAQTVKRNAPDIDTWSIYGRTCGEFHKWTVHVTVTCPADTVQVRYSTSFCNFRLFILIPYKMQFLPPAHCSLFLLSI